MLSRDCILKGDDLCIIPHFLARHKDVKGQRKELKERNLKQAHIEKGKKSMMVADKSKNIKQIKKAERNVMEYMKEKQSINLT